MDLSTFRVGSVVIRTYGLILALGVVAGVMVAERLRQRYKVSKLSVWDGLVWMLIPGLIGARLYHVVDLWGYYRENLELIPQIWTGGMGIFGAIGGGILGLWVFINKNYQKYNRHEKHQEFLKFLDLVAVGLPLGQAIGRWGNFFNQELYGKPTSVPWAIEIDIFHRLPGYEQFTHFHPIFLYESLWNLVNFMVLLWVVRRSKWRLNPGTIFTLYILFYSVCRIIIERVKLDAWQVEIGGLMIPVAQIISGGLIVGAVTVLLKSTKKGRRLK